MKILTTTLSLIILFSFTLNAQEVTDSVSMGGGYTNDVYYSMADGEVENVSNSNWTVAFSTGSQTSQILINGGKGVQLWQTNMDTADFNTTLDTTGHEAWQELYDNDTSWYLSSFETNATGHPDYGWGTYNNTNHTIFGDDVFLIKTLDSDYLKVWIEKKELGEVIMRYASLDNSFDTVVNYQASDLSNKYFVYYDMDVHLFNDREPANTNWDILFTRYHPAEFWGTGQIATGVFNSIHTEVAEVRNVSTSSSMPSDGIYSSDRNVIGYDWKELNFMDFTFDMIPDLSYFLKTSNNDIYKLYFTRFDGTATGVSEFNKEFLQNVTAIDETSTDLALYGLYPNPSSDNVVVLFESNEAKSNNVTIYSVSGKKVFNQDVAVAKGLNSLSIPLNNIETGIYFVHLSNGSTIVKEKLMVTK